MSLALPDTPLSLLSQLKDPDLTLGWQASWKRFLELYQEPLRSMAANSYRFHTNGAPPSEAFIEDAVANVVVDFFSTGHQRYDRARGRLRGLLRQMCNARVVDLLRKQRPLDHIPGDSAFDTPQPAGEIDEEQDAFRRSVLATLVEDLRNRIPIRQFEIFEMVKLKGFSPDQTAEELGIKRGVVDNTVYKVMTRLREMAKAAEYQEEYYG